MSKQVRGVSNQIRRILLSNSIYSSSFNRYTIQCGPISQNGIFSCCKKFNCILNLKLNGPIRYCYNETDYDLGEPKNEYQNLVDKDLQSQIERLSSEEKQKLLMSIVSQDYLKESASIYDVLKHSTNIINKSNVSNVMTSINDALLNLDKHSIKEVESSTEMKNFYSKANSLFVDCSTNDLICSLEVFTKFSSFVDHPAIRHSLQILKYYCSELSMKDILKLHHILRDKRKNFHADKFLYILPVLSEKYITASNIKEYSLIELLQLFRFSSDSKSKNFGLILEEVSHREMNSLQIAISFLSTASRFPIFPYDKMMLLSSSSAAMNKLQTNVCNILTSHAHSLSKNQISLILHLLFMCEENGVDSISFETFYDAIMPRINDMDFSGPEIIAMCSQLYEIGYVNKDLLVAALENLPEDNKISNSHVENLHSLVSMFYKELKPEHIDFFTQYSSEIFGSQQLVGHVPWIKILTELLHMNIYPVDLIEESFKLSFIDRHVFVKKEFLTCVRLTDWMVLYYLIGKSTAHRHIIDDIPESVKYRCTNFLKDVRYQTFLRSLNFSLTPVSQLFMDDSMFASVLLENSLLIDYLVIVDKEGQVKRIFNETVKSPNGTIHYENLVVENSDQKLAIMFIPATSICNPGSQLKPRFALKKRVLEEAGFRVISIVGSTSPESSKNQLRNELIEIGVNENCLTS